MRETTKEIFDKYEVRKTRQEKTAFIDFTLDFARKNGYDAHVENGSFKSRNIVIGDPKTAKVTYTAHYDTCPRLPFPNFITPKNIFIYILYQIFLTVCIFAVPMLVSGLLGFILGRAGVAEDTAFNVIFFVGYALVAIVLYLIMAGPANPHTANDNTSGVTTLFEIMEKLPESERSSVAFIFFDLEEVGTIGSSSYYAKNKQYMKDRLLINFDCVSDGKNMLFVLSKKAVCYEEALKSAFVRNDTYSPEFCSRGVFYPSDQRAFPLGVGVAALKKSKKLGVLYMNRIHTKNDTVYDEENIAYLSDGAVRLAAELAGVSEKQ